MKIKNGVLISINKSKDIKRGKCVIPDRVTSIDNYVFSHCDGLTSITIPDSVTSIGECAFYNCSGLTSVIIPDGVTSIGNWAFSYCSGLTNIIIPDSVTIIGSNAFYGCSSLTNIIISDGVTNIGYETFSFCSSLTSVTIGKGVTNIGYDAFLGCYKLVEVYNKSSLNITKGSTDNGFVGYCAKNMYTEPYVSKLLKDENGYIIYTDGDLVSLIGYTGNETALVLPDNITEINQGAFRNCDSLTSVVIPNSVTSIGEYAFSGCSSLTSVTIPDGVTSIGGGAFSGCSGLNRLTIPKTINKIKCIKGFYQEGDKLKCLNFVYEVGKTYEEPKAKLCKKGFHACTLGLDVFSYYAGKNTVFYEVELSGLSSERRGDSKICGTTITLLRELTVAEAANYRSEIIE